MKSRSKLISLHWLLSAQFGIDPVKMFRAIQAMPRYIAALIIYRSSFTKPFELVPCLHDWHEEGGATTNEYFWQDLLIARKIFAARPKKHVDIGSRVDGFVAHVASFREIEVIDIRPITTNILGIIFKKANLMNPAEEMTDYCDSLSCLHALEHFGLGRYGDPIDPKGYEAGICNMAKILRKEGTFYLSVPVGTERVEFNVQDVFNPRTIMEVAKSNRLQLREFAVFTPVSGWVDVGILPGALESAGEQRYGLGNFTFVKI